MAQAETVEALQKKLFVQKQEMDRLRNDYGALKRNYESISHYAACDSAEVQGIKKARDQFEAQVKNLKVEKLNLEEKMSVAKKEAEF